MNERTTLERAFDLARSGDYATVDEIRAQLKSERHDQVEAHLAGPSIKRQLARLCGESRTPVADPLSESGASHPPSPAC